MGRPFSGSRTRSVTRMMSLLGSLFLAGLLAGPAAADFGQAFDLYVAEEFDKARR
jgi:hypothetical protein